MRIVHVTLRFDGPGGVETTVREVTRRLRARGDEVEVFASDLVEESGWVRGTGFRPVVDGVPVRRFPAVKRALPHYPLPVLAGLVDALADSGADVIHAHSHRYGHLLQAAAVSQRCGIPLVISSHYHPADRGEPPLKKGLLRVEDFLFGMTAYPQASAIVVESDLEARLVAEFAPEERIRRIPPGIDLAEWEAAAADRAAAPSLPPRYDLFVGRIASNKGLDLLIEALALRSAAERVPLVLLGPDWGERAALEDRARRLGVDGDLRWLGAISDRAAYRGVLRGARALVLPSEWEAFGLVLLDAMAAGTPIVATRVGAVPEVLDGGAAGRLVPYGEPSALADGLAAVDRDPQATGDLVAAAARKVRTLDWSTSVDRLREIYRDLAA